MKCRNCQNSIHHELVDLYSSPPSNSFLTNETLNHGEVYLPLKVLVCEKCFLVQIDEFKRSDEIFSKDYVYFSSYSKSWLKHASNYSEMVVKRFNLNEKSFVVEVASNDGYLLKNFVEKKIPCLGVEPTLSTAVVAQSMGIQTRVEFFGVETAAQIVKEFGKADLALGNNVLAHVPNLKDFLGGFKILLKPNGVVTFEFPHLLKLIEDNLFDTIYHEHYSYLSLVTVKDIFSRNGLKVFDVETLPSHGGSLRVYGSLADSQHEVSRRVEELERLEIEKGVTNINFYKDYKLKVEQVKLEFLSFLIEAKKANKRVVAYGAAAKGNTLLNYCGVKPDLISHVADASPHKQGKFLPGSRIPVISEQELIALNPDYIVLFPWNLKKEIHEQFNKYGNSIKLVTFIPRFEIL